MTHSPVVLRRFLTGAVLIAVLGIAGSQALAAGGKFQERFSKGDVGSAFWRSYIDDKAFQSVTVNARQRSGGGDLYVRIEHYALRCAAGQNTCITVGAGGSSIAEGAEWIKKKTHNMDQMPRKRGARATVSERLDPNATAMQVRIYICKTRASVIPDKCGAPRYGVDTYNKS